MDMLKVTIDNIEYQIEKGRTILEAAEEAGIYIPHL